MKRLLIWMRDYRCLIAVPLGLLLSPCLGLHNLERFSGGTRLPSQHCEAFPAVIAKRATLFAKGRTRCSQFYPANTMIAPNDPVGEWRRLDAGSKEVSPTFEVSGCYGTPVASILDRLGSKYPNPVER